MGLCPQYLCCTVLYSTVLHRTAQTAPHTCSFFQGTYSVMGRGCTPVSLFLTYERQASEAKRVRLALWSLLRGSRASSGNSARAKGFISIYCRICKTQETQGGGEERRVLGSGCHGSMAAELLPSFFKQACCEERGRQSCSCWQMLLGPAAGQPTAAAG